MNELIQILENILKSDPRTVMNPSCEYGWIFDRVHDALKKANGVKLSIKKIIEEIDNGGVK